MDDDQHQRRTPAGGPADFEKRPRRQRDRASPPSRTRAQAPLKRAPALPALLSDRGPASSCWCSASCVFSALVGERFFAPFNLSLDPAAGDDHRHRRHRADPDHPDRRHRPVGRRDHGALLGRDGPARRPLRRAGRRSPSRSASSSGAACGFINGVLVTWLRLPPFIVTLGTWSIFGALNLCYLAERDHPQQDIEATAPLLQFIGNRDQVRRRARSPTARS